MFVLGPTVIKNVLNSGDEVEEVEEDLFAIGMHFLIQNVQTASRRSPRLYRYHITSSPRQPALKFTRKTLGAFHEKEA